ncbi:MAG: hypothetical protein KKA75_02515 [Proteobacteria bacterium]|nr:hypothetical protein [Pseudomonadota bacterium]
MKISFEQFRKALQYGSSEKEEATKLAFSPEELHHMKETLKRLPEVDISHLNYSMIMEECEKVSAEDVAEKLLMRRLVDKIFM